MNNQTFSSLPLSSEQLKNLESLGYHTMTDIQAQSLPAVLTGEDVLAQAKTGSGKTAAFGLGVLQQLKVGLSKTQALVLCPTRELAEQVSQELRRLARAIANTKIITLCGGTPMARQLASLTHAPHIVVGTPGRLLKHLEKQTLDLSQLNVLVLDEADRMLDMGFYDDINAIIQQLPIKRQTLLFSATYPEQIQTISQRIQHNPVQVQVDTQQQERNIEQQFYQTEKKLDTVFALLNQHQPASCIIFCNRKQQCRDVADALNRQGAYALTLQGDMEQPERDKALLLFSNQSCSILVATDVAARGLDIKELPLVISYELPHDAEVHVHRIGRTGRAGQKGLAVSLVSETEIKKIAAIEQYQSINIQLQSASAISSTQPKAIKPAMITLELQAGKKDKLRPGDIVGALTATKQLSGDDIGNINIAHRNAYVAVKRDTIQTALELLNNGKIKGRRIKTRRIS